MTFVRSEFFIILHHFQRALTTLANHRVFHCGFRRGSGLKRDLPLAYLGEAWNHWIDLLAGFSLHPLVLCGEQVIVASEDECWCTCKPRHQYGPAIHLYLIEFSFARHKSSFANSASRPTAKKHKSQLLANHRKDCWLLFISPSEEDSLFLS